MKLQTVLALIIGLRHGTNMYYTTVYTHNTHTHNLQSMHVKCVSYPDVLTWPIAWRTLMTVGMEEGERWGGERGRGVE